MAKGVVVTPGHCVLGGAGSAAGFCHGAVGGAGSGELRCQGATAGALGTAEDLDFLSGTEPCIAEFSPATWMTHHMSQMFVCLFGVFFGGG